MVLFALFVLLLMRGLQAASSSRDPFGRLMAVGIVTYILFQVFINIAVNIRLLPVTGIPLPFISQGGSSLVSLFVAMGILQSVRIHHPPPEWRRQAAPAPSSAGTTQWAALIDRRHQLNTSLPLAEEGVFASRKPTPSCSFRRRCLCRR